jgi:hypothetical protein
MSGWVLCTDCHRVLLPEHGPTCPECLAKREALEPPEAVEFPDAQQPMPELKPVAKRKVEPKGE